MSVRYPLLVLIFILLIPLYHQAQAQPSNGREVIQAMYDRHHQSWYEYLTFEQETVFYGPDGKVQRKQTWHEAMHIPGKLAIKFDTKDSGNGILFRDNIQFGFANGQLIQETRRVHQLLVLGFDVYGQHPDTTIKQLQETGYNLEQMYEDEWQGRPVYVVGVNSPTPDEAQFWIDQERLVFVRSVSIGRGQSIQEVQFNKYEKLGDGWVAPEVVFQANGNRGLLETYTKIVLPDSLDPDIFRPESFVGSSW